MACVAALTRPLRGHPPPAGEGREDGRPAREPGRMPPDNPFHHAGYLTGPTAVGKTALAVALAHRLDAEIVALDSMTLYRGLDIGTAKPTPAEREDVPHHLLDVLD